MGRAQGTTQNFQQVMHRYQRPDSFVLDTLQPSPKTRKYVDGLLVEVNKGNYEAALDALRKLDSKDIEKFALPHKMLQEIAAQIYKRNVLTEAGRKQAWLKVGYKGHVPPPRGPSRNNPLLMSSQRQKLKDLETAIT